MTPPEAPHAFDLYAAQRKSLRMLAADVKRSKGLYDWLSHNERRKAR